MKYLKKSKHRWMIVAYGIFYMAAFMLMEQSDAKIHIIHSFLDDKIPFCKYFIIPYVMWYFFLIGTIAYFALACESKREYYQYIATLGVGMTLFLMISWIYPNGQNLRPDLAGDDIFTNAIRFLYKIDTPTNIFPSMHVFNATASGIALYHNKKCRSNKLFTAFNLTLTVSIVLSTMFLKQHSTEDVMTALILNILCYLVFYRLLPENEDLLEEILTGKEICTLPNLLSAIRLGVSFLFLGICERNGLRDVRTVLALFIIAAAATDVLDSLFARELNQISRVGRILDPLANKMMQAVILICLVPYYEMAEAAFLIFLIKEAYTLVVGFQAVRNGYYNQEPQWHGKLNTAVSYVVGFVLVAVPRVSYPMANALLGVSVLYMVLSFILYAEEFRELLDRSAIGRRRKMNRRNRENWIQ